MHRFAQDLAPVSFVVPYLCCPFTGVTLTPPEKMDWPHSYIQEHYLDGEWLWHLLYIQQEYSFTGQWLCQGLNWFDSRDLCPDLIQNLWQILEKKAGQNNFEDCCKIGSVRSSLKSQDASVRQIGINSNILYPYKFWTQYTQSKGSHQKEEKNAHILRGGMSNPNLNPKLLRRVSVYILTI